MDIIRLKTVDSTNNYAKQLLKTEKQNNFTCIVTENQSLGRGQTDAVWLSEKNKNLTFSLIIYPKNIEAKQQFYISKFISLQIVNFLNNIKMGFKIKWPNDIYFNDKKIGGILIENSLAGSKIKNAIIGIGLNINQINFPNNIPNPSSLKLISNKNFDLNNLLKDIIIHIKLNFKNLDNKEFIIIDKNYHNLLYRINEFHKYKDSNGIFIGKIIGTESSGQIIIERKDRFIKKYFLKELKFIF